MTGRLALISSHRDLTNGCLAPDVLAQPVNRGACDVGTGHAEQLEFIKTPESLEPGVHTPGFKMPALARLS